MENSAITLYDLNRLIKNTISEGLPNQFWIRAETSDVRENQNGHCYLELIQKDEKNKSIVAKARASIWSNVYQMLKMYFESETGQAFVSGIKVLVLVTVEFHELYGFSLNIQNIDPNYTIGDQARNRAEILKILEEEGVLAMNKELELSPTANRIAIISSPTAAGYEDFCNQLHNNKRGFKFYTKLFPAIMQGDRTEESVLNALDIINDHFHAFDTVVIIRGGGATSDLSCFDTYMLATSCAQFPLPIITGIGHERDDTVIDIVAHTRAKTPTAVAEFLLNNIKTTEDRLLYIQEQITQQASFRVYNETVRINTLATHFSYLMKDQNKERLNTLKQFEVKLRVAIDSLLKEQKHKIEVKAQHLYLISPENILRKGYSLTLKDNKIVKSSKLIKKGDILTTQFFDGEIESISK